MPSETGRSMFAPDAFLGPDNLQQFAPPAGRGIQAATVLQSLGFRVQHIGTFSISGDGPRELWEQVVGTRVERRSQPLSEAHPEIGEVSYCREKDMTGRQGPDWSMRMSPINSLDQ